jgi:hypothetical protein
METFWLQDDSTADEIKPSVDESSKTTESKALH